MSRVPLLLTVFAFLTANLVSASISKLESKIAKEEVEFQSLQQSLQQIAQVSSYLSSLLQEKLADGSSIEESVSAIEESQEEAFEEEQEVLYEIAKVEKKIFHHEQSLQISILQKSIIADLDKLEKIVKEIAKDVKKGDDASLEKVAELEEEIETLEIEVANDEMELNQMQIEAVENSSLKCLNKQLAKKTAKLQNLESEEIEYEKEIIEDLRILNKIKSANDVDNEEIAIVKSLNKAMNHLVKKQMNVAEKIRFVETDIGLVESAIYYDISVENNVSDDSSDFAGDLMEALLNGSN